LILTTLNVPIKANVSFQNTDYVKTTSKRLNYHSESLAIKMRSDIKGVKCKALLRDSDEFIEATLPVHVRGTTKYT